MLLFSHFNKIYLISKQFINVNDASPIIDSFLENFEDLKAPVFDKKYKKKKMKNQKIDILESSLSFNLTLKDHESFKPLFKDSFFKIVNFQPENSEEELLAHPYPSILTNNIHENIKDYIEEKKEQLSFFEINILSFREISKMFWN